MMITQETIRLIAEYKFPGDDKKAEEYIRNFNPSDPACIDDEREFHSRIADVDGKVGEMRQRFRTEDYFIRKMIYDFYTGEIHVFFFSHNDENVRRRALELTKGNAEEQKMAEWIRGGFTDKPLTLSDEKPPLYEEAMAKFSEKYGVFLDVENVASSIREIAKEEERRENTFRQYFKCLFASAYCRLDPGKQEHIDSFCKDFNRVLMVALQEKTGDGEVPAMQVGKFAYGGMSENEIKEYLLSFREAANDLTMQAQNEQKKEKDPFAETVKKVQGILKDKDDTKENKLSRGMAELQALENTHKARPKHYWLTSPIRNILEKRTISKIKGMMVDFSANPEQVKEMERRRTIYRPSFARERERINSFAASAVREFDLDTILSADTLDLEELALMPITEERESTVEPAFRDDNLFKDSDEIAPPIVPPVPENEPDAPTLTPDN